MRKKVRRGALMARCCSPCCVLRRGNFVDDMVWPKLSNMEDGGLGRSGGWVAHDLLAPDCQ